MSDNGNDLHGIDFSSLVPWEIPIKGLLGKNYVLKEATGRAGCKYKDELAACIERDEKGNLRSRGGLKQTELNIIARCMFEEDGKTPVTLAFVENLPFSVTSRLFETLEKGSGLSVPVAGEGAKNPSSATTVGSV